MKNNEFALVAIEKGAFLVALYYGHQIKKKIEETKITEQKTQLM